jgi:hypothetical protein
VKPADDSDADQASEPPNEEIAGAGAEIVPLVTADEAARLLATTPTALRARCRRCARRIGREVVARLGAGVVAFKFGASWRFRLEPLRWGTRARRCAILSPFVKRRP